MPRPVESSLWRIALAWFALALTDLRLKFLPYQWNKMFIFPEVSADSQPDSQPDSQVDSQANLVPTAPLDSPEALQVARALATIVAKAGSHPFPFTMTCLRRSLVLRGMLARRGIASKLVLGAAPQGAGLAHHAWIEVVGVRIDTYGDPDRYEAYR